MAYDNENSVSIQRMKKPQHFTEVFQQRYKDSNLENDGVRVRCLTVWR